MEYDSPKVLIRAVTGHRTVDKTIEPFLVSSSFAAYPNHQLAMFLGFAAFVLPNSIVVRPAVRLLRRLVMQRKHDIKWNGAADHCHRKFRVLYRIRTDVVESGKR